MQKNNRTMMMICNLQKALKRLSKLVNKEIKVPLYNLLKFNFNKFLKNVKSMQKLIGLIALQKYSLIKFLKKTDVIVVVKEELDNHFLTVHNLKKLTSFSPYETAAKSSYTSEI